jgi:hypothetical protein
MTSPEWSSPIPASQETAESFGLEGVTHGTFGRPHASETDLWRKLEMFRCGKD